ncbi:MAG: hypothetical protein J4478_01145 [Candidatus Diapherotrites archaeon]|uniref:Transcription regulator TrmB N-terminal domain-containing protein n=1 Tax=Candidatus Iainarchaeum sp. TaxID=3101447 RepID=A0A8T4KZ65_9ARCH|nr:hypothetical protein [Candidatus Diapherotrites archaeon]
MDFELLTEIGLTQNEAKTYLALIELRSASAKQISEKSGIHKRNVYESLEKLMKKGLVASGIVSRSRHFEAANPEQLLSYLEEKEAKVKNLLLELKSKYLPEPANDEALIFRGINGIKAILQDMLKVKNDLYLIGSKGYWKTLPELKFFFPQFENKRIKLGLKIKQIYDHELRNKRITKFKLGECKFFPPQYSTPIHIWIYGNRVISLFYADNPTAFMIKSQKIANGYKKYFNFMWHLAEK